MPSRGAASLMEIDRKRLRGMSRAELEEFAWSVVELARRQANRLGGNSSNSSRPPSSDDPYRRGEERAKGDGEGDERGTTNPGGEASPAKADKSVRNPPGKRAGMPGYWRTQPIVVDRQIEHQPDACAACGAALEALHRSRQASAHYVYDLERSPMALSIGACKHRYFAARCICGHETLAEPGRGACSAMEGRRRDLQLSERVLVGPTLCAFIAALSVRLRLSRRKIREFLLEWLGFELGTASIDRCIREFGMACEPVVDDLIKDVRDSEIVHMDETPWYQHGALLWLWVMANKTTAVFRIGSRGKQELTALLGEAYLGWLVSDGYGAYRDHPRRQRCLAHLIRKAVALAEGYYRDGSAFGRDLARDLRRLIERVAQGDDDAGINRLVARIRRTCESHRYEDEAKVRALAREILNDWEAVIAFVDDPRLPPTNNDAERALRHAVIARRISFGTRTHEGSRCYAAALSVVETCRKRAVEFVAYASALIASARKGLPHPLIPMPAPP
jgi:hypothetical protein